MDKELFYYNSTKEKQKLAYKGYVYTKDKTTNQTCYWKSERRSLYCTGRLVVKEGTVTKCSPHNHAPDMSVAKIQIAISQMKESVGNGREGTSAIMNREMQKVAREYRPYFPTDSSIRRTLQRKRRKEQPALPQSLNDVQIEGNVILNIEW